LPLSINNGTIDLVGSKLPALQAYQLSLKAPPAPAGSFDVAAAARGKQIFEGVGNCVRCHSGESFTDANSQLHLISESVATQNIPPYASRSATKQYRTAPLKGVWQHAPYFHNGSAATLEEVVQTYNAKQFLGLTPVQVNDLAQYLRSL
jgi:cytochrome c peroxidase